MNDLNKKVIHNKDITMCKGKRDEIFVIDFWFYSNACHAY